MQPADRARGGYAHEPCSKLRFDLSPAPEWTCSPLGHEGQKALQPLSQHVLPEERPEIADVDDDQLVYWTGIEFVEPSEHVSVAIEEFLKSVRAERL